MRRSRSRASFTTAHVEFRLTATPHTIQHATIPVPANRDVNGYVRFTISQRYGTSLAAFCGITDLRKGF